MEQQKPEPKKEKQDKHKQPKPVNPSKQSKQQPQVPDNVVKQLEEITRRLRLLEERYSGLRKKTQFTEQNMLKDAKDLFEEISSLQETISELKNEMSELIEKLGKLSEEVNNAVSKTEFNVLAKYIDYWQPMNFLTRKEAEELISELKKN